MLRIVLCTLLCGALVGPVWARGPHGAPMMPPGGGAPGRAAVGYGQPRPMHHPAARPPQAVRPAPHPGGMGPRPGMHHGRGMWRGPAPHDLHHWRRGPAPHAHYRSCWYDNVWYDAYGYPYYYGSTTVVTPAPVVVTPAPVVAPAPVVVTPAPTVVTPAPAPAVVY